MKITIKMRKEFIRGQLRTSRTWAIRALMLMYECQTFIEKTVVKTIIKNGIGFSKADDEAMSVFTVRLKVHQKLTDNEWRVIHKTMQKYWKQVLDRCDLPKLDDLIRKHASKNILQCTLKL